MEYQKKFLSDADDVVEPDVLEKLYNTTLEYGADCVCELYNYPETLRKQNKLIN